MMKNNRLPFFILAILTVFVYFNSLGNAFLSDDLPEIVNNPNIGNLSFAISTHPFGFIRPLLYFTAFQFSGLNPVIFRLFDIFLHTGSVFLVYALANLLLQNKRVAFFSAAVFAVHPLLVEPVIWISGGSYPQYSFFFLLSLLFYILSPKRQLFYPLSLFTYLLSFMSHPVMPSSLVLIYPLYELVFGNLKKNWARAIPFALILLVYVFVNMGGLPEREQTLQSVHSQERGVDNVFVLVPVAVTSYLNLIFWPKDLTLYHSELALSQTAFLLTALEFLAFLGVMVFFFKKDRKVFFWLSFFLISLLPTLTPFRLNWIVAERYAYLGSAGVFIVLVYLLDKLLSRKKFQPLFFGLLILTLAALSVRTVIRSVDWKNEDNLWIATGKTSPSSPNTHNNLGDVYGRWGNKEKAVEEFKKAIELKPNYADAYHNLGNAYHDLGKDDLALENYQKAANINPNLWQSYQNMAALYFNVGQYEKALENIQKAIKINPQNIALYNNLGVIYLALGNNAKAKEIFQLVLSADPQNQMAQKGLEEAQK